MRHRRWAVVAIVFLAPTGAFAGNGRPRVIPDPGDSVTWHVCDGKQPYRYYPIDAHHLKIEGSAQIACRITPAGKPTACTFLEESPAGYGFGKTRAKLGCLFKYQKDVVEEAVASGMIPLTPLTFKLP